MASKKKKKKKREEQNGPTPGTPRNIQPGYHKDKIYFIPRRNTRCLTNPFLQTRKQCGTRTKQKPNAPKGINIFPLTLGRWSAFDHVQVRVQSTMAHLYRTLTPRNHTLLKQGTHYEPNQGLGHSSSMESQDQYRYPHRPDYEPRLWAQFDNKNFRDRKMGKIHKSNGPRKTNNGKYRKNHRN